MSQMEAYYTILYAFLQAVRNNRVPYLPRETDSSLWYVRLSIDGSWEVTKAFTDNLGLVSSTSEKEVPQGICLPLVLPITPIILAAHLETQRARIEVEEALAKTQGFIAV